VNVLSIVYIQDTILKPMLSVKNDANKILYEGQQKAIMTYIKYKGKYTTLRKNYYLAELRNVCA